MKFTLLNIGKTYDPFLIEGINHYCNRINHYYPFTVNNLIINYKTKSNIELIKTEEEKSIQANLCAADFVILLDEKGKEFTSREFAETLNNLLNNGRYKHIVFITGGAYGFSKPIYDRANLKISLSKLTFPHQLVRLIFCEQLYRAFTILKGEKYHHD